MAKKDLRRNRKRIKPGPFLKAVTTELLCKRCNTTRPGDQFSRDKSRPSGRCAYCKKCVLKYHHEHNRRPEVMAKMREKSKAYYRAKRPLHQQRVKRSYLERAFGITPQQKERMRRLQNGLCATCASPREEKRDLAVDHCHESGRVRGLLCSRCNLTLGAVNDSAALLRAMADYLERAEPEYRLVILEVPYRANPKKFIPYLRECIADSVRRKESPFSSVATYVLSGALSDDLPLERAIGISAGLDWYDRAEGCVVYVDYGISEGMQAGISAAERLGVPIEYRQLYGPLVGGARHGG